MSNLQQFRFPHDGSGFFSNICSQMTESNFTSNPSPQSVNIQLTVETARNSPELSNMTIGQLLGKKRNALTPLVASHIASSSGGHFIPITRNNIVFAGQNRDPYNISYASSDLSRLNFIQSNPMPLSQVQTLDNSVTMRPVVENKQPLTLDSNNLDTITRQVDPLAILEESVKDALIEIVDDITEQMVDMSCKVARHRGSSKLETKDVEYTLQKFFDIPTFVYKDELRKLFQQDDHDLREKRRKCENEFRRDNGRGLVSFNSHKQRMQMIKKNIRKP